MKKVLVVDDESEILELVRGRLKSRGYEVIAAETAKEGLKLARDERPDLILMDIMMPETTGGDAVRELQKDPATESIPVIFLSGVFGKDQQGKETRGINVGGRYYPSIGKPFEADELLAMIQDVLVP